jgi:hypothetical protein
MFRFSTRGGSGSVGNLLEEGKGGIFKFLENSSFLVSDSSMFW